MGFCLFNNIALAARHALTAHQLDRVLIVDWDVHHGNGTQDIFYEDPRVMFFSIHRYGRGFYPGTGAAGETGEGPGLGFTFVPLSNLALVGAGVHDPGAASAVPASAPEASPEPVAASRPPAAASSAAPLLSSREHEVAELILTGLTYRQIGERLFISAKTVEHHVARMRQRLDVTSRDELFAQLRMLVGASGG